MLEHRVLLYNIQFTRRWRQEYCKIKYLKDWHPWSVKSSMASTISSCAEAPRSGVDDSRRELLFSKLHSIFVSRYLGLSELPIGRVDRVLVNFAFSNLSFWAKICRCSLHKARMPEAATTKRERVFKFNDVSTLLSMFAHPFHLNT